MTSKAAVPACSPSGEQVSPAAERFTREIVHLQSQLRWGGLLDAIEGDPLFYFDGFGDGLRTVAVRESQLPPRYLRGVMGFRLGQFIEMGWMDRALIHSRALHSEPVGLHTGPEPLHTITITDTGKIVGYMALVGSNDPAGLALDSSRRSLFPAEVAHRVELLSPFAAPGRTTHNAWELKRFIRDLQMPKGLQRGRVPWHLIFTLGRASLELGSPFEVLLGDSREDGALRHFRLAGFDPIVLSSTPRLPHTELMWPSYEVDDVAKPFAGLLPPTFQDFMDAVGDALADTRSDWRERAAQRFLALLSETQSPAQNTHRELEKV